MEVALLGPLEVSGATGLIPLSPAPGSAVALTALAVWGRGGGEQ